MKIAIGSDHGGYEMKKHIVKHLLDKGFTVTDFGSDSPESVDYPVYAKKVADEVAAGAYDRGILVCGTGVGISIAANKVKGIRAVVCSEPFSAEMSRAHNDANILALGGRVIDMAMAEKLVDIFLATEFEGGRHKTRVDMIMALEG